MHAKSCCSASSHDNKRPLHGGDQQLDLASEKTGVCVVIDGHAQVFCYLSRLVHTYEVRYTGRSQTYALGKYTYTETQIDMTDLTYRPANKK